MIVLIAEGRIRYAESDVVTLGDPNYVDTWDGIPEFICLLLPPSIMSILT